ncbi:hypothetical protein QFC19_007842 [Naganishia cerealis]|uniref:Uncharacterized protein n=1 Tax=Naganishia cerealis TaxID=610337 RepID=A0ACC2V5I8_9TREE|nr:hypothetical protein QFC19_007842 [Naganishia cerealis]
MSPSIAADVHAHGHHSETLKEDAHVTDKVASPKDEQLVLNTYLYLHFSGHEAWTLDQIKQYHALIMGGSMAAGHPEIEYSGCEVTTGPLGQGISNAVGMAIASKQFAATYNKDDLKVVDNKIWCFTGDGCLQEGSFSAISLAGHLGINNLILIYDNNSLTVNGNIDACFSEDTSAKLAAQGWHVIEPSKSGLDGLKEARRDCESSDAQLTNAAKAEHFMKESGATLLGPSIGNLHERYINPPNFDSKL